MTVQAYSGPEVSRRLRLPDFKKIGYMKVVRLSAIRTGRLYASADIPGTHLLEAESTPGPQCDRKDYVNKKIPMIA